MNERGVSQVRDLLGPLEQTELLVEDVRERDADADGLDVLDVEQRFGAGRAADDLPTNTPGGSAQHCRKRPLHPNQEHSVVSIRRQDQEQSVQTTGRHGRSLWQAVRAPPGCGSRSGRPCRFGCLR